MKATHPRLTTLVWAAGLTLAVGAAGLSGCDKGSGDKAKEGSEAKAEEAKPKAEPEVPQAEPKTEAAAEPAAEQPADEAAAGKSVAEVRREKLAAAMKAVYCAQAKDDGANILAIYKAHGYESPAAFNEAWEKDAKKKADWAEATLSALTPEACSTP